MNRETPPPNDQSASARRDAARTLAQLLLSAEDYERRAGSSSDSEEWFRAESQSLLRWAGETGRLLSVAEYGSLLKGFKLLDGGLEQRVPDGVGTAGTFHSGVQIGRPDPEPTLALAPRRRKWDVCPAAPRELGVRNINQARGQANLLALALAYREQHQMAEGHPDQYSSSVAPHRKPRCRKRSCRKCSSCSRKVVSPNHWP